MRFEYWNEGFLFIGLFMIMVGLPCLLTAILGVKLIDRLGQYPTKSAKLQLGICVQLFFVQVLGITMLAAFFKFFSN